MPEIGPQNDMEPSEAQELGLTNSDYMRYRWTGELPPDAQAVANQRFRDQTRPPQFLPTSPSPGNEPSLEQLDSLPNDLLTATTMVLGHQSKRCQIQLLLAGCKPGTL